MELGRRSWTPSEFHGEAPVSWNSAGDHGRHLSAGVGTIVLWSDYLRIRMLYCSAHDGISVVQLLEMKLEMI